MPQAPLHAFGSTPTPYSTVTTTNDLTAPDSLATFDKLTPRDRTHLGDLLTHKLRDIPTGHLPDLRLEDVLQQTPKTILVNVPREIGLKWFLQYRVVIDEYIDTGLGFNEQNEEGRKIDEEVVRAVWYYRLDPVRQFQRYHDAVRWNLAIFTALLASHTLNGRRESDNVRDNTQMCRRDVPALELSPAAVRFMTLYLAAVLEHHISPTTFDKRDGFIQLWRRSSLDLFTIHKSWVKKALQRSLKQLSSEWDSELSYTRHELGKEAYEERVGKFIGSIIPGRTDQNRLITKGASGGKEKDQKMHTEGSELLDALRTPCPRFTVDAHAQETTEEGRLTVCDLRTAVTCVQNMRPRDMLPVLIQLFPPDEIENEKRGPQGPKDDKTEVYRL